MGEPGWLGRVWSGREWRVGPCLDEAYGEGAVWEGGRAKGQGLARCEEGAGSNLKVGDAMPVGSA